MEGTRICIARDRLERSCFQASLTRQALVTYFVLTDTIPANCPLSTIVPIKVGGSFQTSINYLHLNHWCSHQLGQTSTARTLPIQTHVASKTRVLKPMQPRNTLVVCLLCRPIQVLYGHVPHVVGPADIAAFVSVSVADVPRRAALGGRIGLCRVHQNLAHGVSGCVIHGADDRIVDPRRRCSEGPGTSPAVLVLLSPNQ